MPVWGSSWRITRAASNPSRLWVGGIRISTIARSGAFSRTSARSNAPSPACPTTSKSERSSRLARPSRSRTSSSARTARSLAITVALGQYGAASTPSLGPASLDRFLAARTLRKPRPTGGWREGRTDPSDGCGQRPARADRRRRVRGPALHGRRDARGRAAREAVPRGARGRQPARAADRRRGDGPARVRLHRAAEPPRAMARRLRRLSRAVHNPGTTGRGQPRPAGPGTANRPVRRVLPRGLRGPVGRVRPAGPRIRANHCGDRSGQAAPRRDPGRVRRLDRGRGRPRAAAAGGLVGSVLLIVLFAGYLHRAIVRPVRLAAAMAGRLADGDLSVRLPESGRGEIGVLEHSFNTMAGSLRESRELLTRSRARIVAAADQARRRIERDLHDGTQQRLVSLVLNLRAAGAALPVEPAEPRRQLAELADELASATDDLRVLSRGIHPAVLSEGGLPPALAALARRSAVPVELDLDVPARLPEQVEVAAYYVVSEALTNVAKHARASLAHVELRVSAEGLHLSVRDDGVGGASPGPGSGLIGLIDRVEIGR